jgi:hypothetical protein
MLKQEMDYYIIIIWHEHATKTTTNKVNVASKLKVCKTGQSYITFRNFLSESMQLEIELSYISHYFSDGICWKHILVKKVSTQITMDCHQSLQCLGQ